MIAADCVISCDYCKFGSIVTSTGSVTPKANANIFIGIFNTGVAAQSVQACRWWSCSLEILQITALFPIIEVGKPQPVYYVYLFIFICCTNNNCIIIYTKLDSCFIIFILKGNFCIKMNKTFLFYALRHQILLNQNSQS